MNKRVVRYRAIALLLVTTSPLAAQRGSLGPHDRWVSFIHDGQRRRFILHTPNGEDRQRDRPLVLVLHGGGGTPLNMLGLTQGRFNELADRDTVWVIYPEGLKKNWNDQREDTISYAHTNDIDDVGFIRAIIDAMKEKYGIDRTRVFATGISNGGFMSYRLGIELAGVIRAVAPVTATIPAAGVKAVPGMAAPVSLLLINGTGDPLVPYEGGVVKVLRRERGRITSTAETIRLWRDQAGCDTGPVVTELPDRDPGDGCRAVRYDYASGRGDVRVTLIEVQGGGHTWPGGPQYLWRRMIGRLCRDFDACDVIWEFFREVSDE